MNKNPCSGPGLEGVRFSPLSTPDSTSLIPPTLQIQSLRTAFTLNTGLGLVGVMALSGGLKAKWVMRYLDVDVPFGDEEFARWVAGLLMGFLGCVERF